MNSSKISVCPSSSLESKMAVASMEAVKKWATVVAMQFCKKICKVRLGAFIFYDHPNVIEPVIVQVRNGFTKLEYLHDLK